MVFNILLLVAAMAGLTLSADRFVAGAAELAARLNVSTVVAGALIIGCGVQPMMGSRTSPPISVSCRNRPACR